MEATQEGVVVIARGKLYAALAKAQAEIKGALKDKKNPHFGSDYADLASIVEACKDALTKHGICVIQEPCSDGPRVGCVTILGHESGEERVSPPLWTTPRDQGPQAVGSCVTYLRRYQLAAMVGVAPEDDDGEGAEGRSAAPPRRATRAAAPPPANGASKPAEPPPGDRPTSDLLNEIVALLKSLGWPRQHISSWLQQHANVQTVGALSAAKANEVRGLLSDALEQQAAEAERERAQ